MKTIVHDHNLQNRYGESGSPPTRTKRIYCENNEWYFHTREYGTYGPYSSFLQAREELSLYLRRLGIVKQAVV